MPKTKNGGFILDDSGLAPYGVKAKKSSSKSDNKSGKNKKAGNKDGRGA